MHCATIKIMKAQQAKLNNNYKNTRLKLLKTKATIRFSKSICWLIIKVCLQYFVQNNKKKNGKCKGTFHPTAYRNCTEGAHTFTSTLYLTSELGGVGGGIHKRTLISCCIVHEPRVDYHHLLGESGIRRPAVTTKHSSIFCCCGSKFDVCVTLHHGYNNINSQLDPKIMILLIISINSTCFGAIISPILRSTRLYLQLVV